MSGISIVTPLMKVNRGDRCRNWHSVYKHLIPLVRSYGHEWVVAEQGSTQGNLPGVKKVSVFGSKNRSQMRNIGWRNSSSEMVCFLDGDIVMEGAAWERAFKECWSYDCYSPYARGVYLGAKQTTNRLSRLVAGKWPRRLPPSRRWNLCGGVCFMRRSVLESFDGWDERFSGWGYEDIAIEKLIRSGGFTWKVDRSHMAVHLFHPTTPGKRSQGHNMRKLYRREYANRKFADIVARKRGHVATESHLGGHGGVTHVDMGSMNFFWKTLECRSVLDVGCGPGGHVAAAEDNGWFAKGIDGDKTIERSIDCSLIDFTKEKYDPGSEEFDLAWCVEFVEHIDEKFFDNYLPAFLSAKYLLLTHARPGKAGHHHVNCQPSSYWIKKLAEAGLVYSQQLTRQVKEASTMQREFVQQTGMVFANQHRTEILRAPEPTRRAIIFRGQGRNAWVQSFSEMLEDRGYRVEITVDAAKIQDQDQVIFWNGQLPGDKVAIERAKKLNLPHCFLEVGYFRQGNHMMISRHGSTGGSLLLGEELEPLTAEQDRELDEFFVRYAPDRVRDTGSHLIAMLQVESDTAIRNYSPFQKMQDFVDHVERIYPTDEVRFKAHPQAKDIRLRCREPVIRDGSLWDHMMSAKLCVGINSTSLYEAILAKVPVLSLGGSVLATHPNCHCRIAYEILHRQVHINGCDDFDQRVERSLGRSF